MDARNRAPGPGRAGSTPDTATWNERVDVDVELLGEHEPVDQVDLVDANWAPGEGRPGVPADEVLHVHGEDDTAEVIADELEVDELAAEELEPAPDELFEGEAGED